MRPIRIPVANMNNMNVTLAPADGKLPLTTTAFFFGMMLAPMKKLCLQSTKRPTRMPYLYFGSLAWSSAIIS